MARGRVRLAVGFAFIASCVVAAAGCDVGGRRTYEDSRHSQRKAKQRDEDTVVFDCKPYPEEPLPQAVKVISVVPPTITVDESLGLGAVGKYQADFSDIIRAKVEASLQNAYPGVRFVEGDEDRGRLAKERRMQDLGENGDEPAAPTRRSKPDALLTARISWEYTESENEKQEIDSVRTGMNLVGVVSGNRLDPGLVETSRVKYVNSDVTVTVALKLTSTHSNVRLLSPYNDVKTERQQSREDLWGAHAGNTKADFEPKNSVIARLIEKHVDDFIRPLLPQDECEARFPRRSSNIRRAMDYFENDEYQEAVNLAKEEYRDGNAHGAYLLGVISEHTGRDDKAAMWYTRAKELSPRNKDYRNAIDRINYVPAGEAAAFGGDNDEYGVDAAPPSDDDYGVDP